MSVRHLVDLVPRPTSAPPGTSGSLGAGPAAAGGSPRPRRLRLHVTLGFLITATIPGIAGGPKAMAMWGAIVFASLLAHELGHALVGLLSGSRVTVILYPLGGETRIDPRLSRRRSIGAHLAGPLVNLTLGLCLAALRAKTGSTPWIDVALLVNVLWGACNLLPVLPFDGGRILLEALGEGRATQALAISTSVAAGIAGAGLSVFRSLAIALVFGAAAVVSFAEWNKRRRAEDETRLGLPWHLQVAKALLDQDRPIEARGIAQAVVEQAKTPATERAARELVAWSNLALGQPEKARKALSRDRSPQSAYCWAAIEDACGHAERALAILEKARLSGALGAGAIKLLIDIHARRGELQRACRVALEELGTLAPNDVRLVVDAAIGAGQLAPAADLAEALSRGTRCPD